MVLWRLCKTIAFLVGASLCQSVPLKVWSLCAYLCATRRAVSDVEFFVLAHALNIGLTELFPAGLLKRIREGKIEPFHIRSAKD